MISPGGLITKIAEATDIAPTTVGLFARALREAGLLTTGGRGSSAPHMQTIDAARLLLAHLASETAETAPRAVRDFGELIALADPTGSGHKPFRARFEERLGKRRTFLHGICELIDMFRHEHGAEYFQAASDEATKMLGGISATPACGIIVNVTKFSAAIEISGFRYTYRHPGYIALMMNQDDPESEKLIRQWRKVGDRYWSGIKTQRSALGDVIEKIAMGFGDER